MRIDMIAFTQQGYRLGRKLERILNDEGEQARLACGFGKEKQPLSQWCQRAFSESDALLFIGAAGIAVRAAAPYLVSKTTDPAVLSLDDTARFCIPLAGGHIGGANRLAQRIARLTGAQPVITTATDRNGVFAFDEWAAQQNMKIENPGAIRKVSGSLLAGGQIRLRCDFPLEGALPQGVVLVTDKQYDVRITMKAAGRKSALILIPPVASVGVG